jgi:transcription elongation factor Elf1
MPLVWMVECKICALRFPVRPRERTAGKSTDALAGNVEGGRFECPHCHEREDYSSAEFIPGEGRLAPGSERP